MGEACGMRRSVQQFIQNYSGNVEQNRLLGRSRQMSAQYENGPWNLIGYQRVERSYLAQAAVQLWTFTTQYWTFMFLENWTTSWLADDPLPSQESVCCMKLPYFSIDNARVIYTKKV